MRHPPIERREAEPASGSAHLRWSRIGDNCSRSATRTSVATAGRGSPVPSPLRFGAPGPLIQNPIPCCLAVSDELDRTGHCFGLLHDAPNAGPVKVQLLLLARTQTTTEVTARGSFDNVKQQLALIVAEILPRLDRLRTRSCKTRIDSSNRRLSGSAAPACAGRAYRIGPSVADQK